MKSQLLKQSWTKVVLTLFAVLITTKFGGVFGFPPAGLSTFWPPNAVLLACVILLPPPFKTTCLLLSIPVYIVAELWIGFDLSRAILLTCANVVEVCVALWLINKFSEETPFRLSNVTQLLIFISAVLTASIPGAVIGAAGIWFTGGPFFSVFVGWFLSDLVGFLVFTPLTLSIPLWRDWMRVANSEELLTTLALFFILAVLTALAHAQTLLWDLDLVGAQFLSVPIMLVIAVRTGPKGAALASLIVAAIAIGMAINELGPYSYLSPENNVRSLQVFVSSLVLSTLTVAVLINDRQLILHELAKSNGLLKQRVDKSDQELVISEDRFKHLVNAAPICIHELNLEGQVVSMNLAGLEMLGLTNETEVIGLDYFSIPAPEKRDEVNGFFEQARKGNSSEFDFYSETGSGTKYFESSFVPINDQYGDVVRILGVTKNTTSRVIAEDSLRRSQKMEAVGQLTGGIAHDFNNLLSVILGNVELFQLTDYGNDDAKHIKAVKAAVGRGASLTNRLLAYSRKSKLTPVATDIELRLTNNQEIFERLLGATIELDISSVSPLWQCSIDQNQFDDCLLNLAINARDAMPMGGVLKITAQNRSLGKNDETSIEDFITGDYIVVEVVDTGIGVDPKLLGKVFDPFYTTKKFGSGSGLGLSMVYGFAKQSDGHVKIESERGVGTKLSLYLPRVVLDSVSDNATLIDIVHTELKTGRILVVEDNLEILNLCVFSLRQQGYSIEQATNGEEAMEVLSKNIHFDLLFTDLVLPGRMNGTDIARFAMKQNPKINVVYTTGYVEFSELSGMEIDRDIPIIGKPYSRNVLFDAIDLALS